MFLGGNHVVINPNILARTDARAKEPDRLRAHTLGLLSEGSTAQPNPAPVRGFLLACHVLWLAYWRYATVEGRQLHLPGGAGHGGRRSCNLEWVQQGLNLDICWS